MWRPFSHLARNHRVRILYLSFTLFCLASGMAAAQEEASWSVKFDGRVRFYQATEIGTLLIGTENSLYSVDAKTGEILWRRKNVSLDETDVAPVPGTDLLLLSLERNDKTRLEALDILTGETLWQSDKVKGAVMQTAVDEEAHTLAAVCVRDAKGPARADFKRRPVVHVFDLGAGRELWKRDLESEVEMMPALWSEKETEAVPHTLDNYHPPAFLDHRLYLFYEGVTALDASSGKESAREKFRVNEEGLALTEADAIVDDNFIYTSGRGRVRAISRANGQTKWEAKDLGLTPEMILASNALYVRTGGRFTSLKDGETIERGPYGVSRIDPVNGKILWRYKGADKGITNLAMPDESTILIADRDDLIVIDAATGKRRARIPHKVERAGFVLINERNEAVVGGRNEIAAFDPMSGAQLWRARYEAPQRGVLRTVAAVAARAASLYFRYGGAGVTAFRGVQVARAGLGLGTLRWSGLAARAMFPNLTTLATNAARESMTMRFTAFGLAARARNLSSYQPPRMPRVSTPTLPSRDSSGQSLLNRLDPAGQLDRLADYLLRRQRLAALRGQWMYFYTDLLNIGGRGLAGVNINTGQTERTIRLNDPDDRFITDETLNLLYTAKDDRLLAYSINGRKVER
jgi:outer membrane protein assembly factor BamB